MIQFFNKNEKALENFYKIPKYFTTELTIYKIVSDIVSKLCFSSENLSLKNIKDPKFWVKKCKQMISILDPRNRDNDSDSDQIHD